MKEPYPGLFDRTSQKGLIASPHERLGQFKEKRGRLLSGGNLRELKSDFCVPSLIECVNEQTKLRPTV
jgi:hypothetical protein